MIKLNVNEEKQLTFQVQIGGVNYDQVVSHFRLNIEGVEYGFPAKVTEEAIIVNLPALNKVINTRKLKEGEEVQVKLEMIANGHYLTPWNDTAKISNPLIVEAKMVGDAISVTPRLTVSESTVPYTPPKQEIKREPEGVSELDLTEKIVDRLAEKLSKLFVKEQSLPEKEKANQEEEEDDLQKAVEFATMADEPKPQPIPPSPMKESRPVRAQKQKKISENKSDSDLKNMVYETLRKLHDKKNISETVVPKKVVDKPKNFNLQEMKKKLTKEDILNYMAKRGAKNVKVQEVIFTKASEKAKSSEMFDILQEVAKILSSKKK